MNGALSDRQLLERFVQTRSHDAFAQIVSQHVHLVYAAASRQVRHRQMAEDITQEVFAALARKAATLRDEQVLAAWLLVATRRTCLTFLRQERRRQRREQKAASMQPTTTPPDHGRESDELLPLLDAALASLGEVDRRAIVLRFFCGASDRDAAGMLGMTENTLRQRRFRSLEKLRAYCRRRGLDIGAEALAGAIAANALRAAPPHLAAAATRYALAAAPPAAAAAAMKGILLMSWMKAKSATVAAIVILLLGGAGLLVANQMRGGGSNTMLAAAPPPIPPVVRPARFAPGEQIPARAYHTKRGAQDLSNAMGYLDTGSSLGYSNVDFGQGGGVFLACIAVPADHAGKQIVVRADRQDGPVIARLTVRSTGGWGKLEVQSTPLNPIQGTHDVYLSFTGSGVANLYWMRFAPAAVPSEGGKSVGIQPFLDIIPRLGHSIGPTTRPAAATTQPGARALP